jgi:hypothetical protein
MAVGFVALLAALSGTAVALPGVNLIDSGDIKNGQVKRTDIGKNAVNGAKVANSALTGADVKDESLTPSDFSGSVQGPAGAQGPKGPGRRSRAAHTGSPRPRAPTLVGQPPLQVSDLRPVARPALRMAQRNTASLAVLIHVAEIPAGARRDRVAAAPPHHPAGAHPADPALALLLVDRA